MSTETDGSQVSSGRLRKPLLISYVRREADSHARRLKRELQNLGFDVFLDVDEIRCGEDWMDALNYAVLNCWVFIPLITPKYGYTQWTNREIKLADVMNKLIIPINFLEDWPPVCLAIQFASTQYIPWKSEADIEKGLANGKEDQVKDIRLWDDLFIRTVANNIGERFKRKISSIQRSKLGVQFENPFKTRGALGAPGAKQEKLLIVISAHPTDKQIVELMTQKLKSEFIVWSSTELSSEDSRHSIQNNPIPPVISGQTSTLSPQDFDRVRSFKEKVEESVLVIIVFSDVYCKSKTSKGQAFFCETRKKVIPIKLNEFESPKWMSKLFEEDDMIEYMADTSDSFIAELKQTVSVKIG